jgi:DNA-binding LytR/AlgR family response regulator
MDVEVCFEPDRPKPKIVIHTKEMTFEITELIKRLTDYSDQILVGYKDGEVLLIRLEDIYRIYAQNQKVMVQTQKEAVQVKFRLYELEERLAGTRLMRISNSEIVNMKKVNSLDLSMVGTITIKFDTGEKAFVSRRYVEKIKNHLGI